MGAKKRLNVTEGLLGPAKHTEQLRRDPKRKPEFTVFIGLLLLLIEKVKKYLTEFINYVVEKNYIHQ